MFRTERVTEQSKDLTKIKRLYHLAFPANERRPLITLLQDASGVSDFMAFYDDDIFCGFACLLTYSDITHILYFAIDETLRGKGYGTMALKAMRRMKPNHRFIADIEVETPTADNNEQRRKRKQFYIGNGYIESEVAYGWRQENYEILVCGGSLTEKEFDDFWRYFEVERKNFSEF